MPQRLSTVEDVFELSGRGGCVVVPGVPHGRAVTVGTPIAVRRPDGSELRTSARGFEMGARRPLPGIPVLLGPNVKKADLPIGSELWILDEEST